MSNQNELLRCQWLNYLCLQLYSEHSFEKILLIPSFLIDHYVGACSFLVFIFAIQNDRLADFFVKMDAAPPVIFNYFLRRPKLLPENSIFFTSSLSLMVFFPLLFYQHQRQLNFSKEVLWSISNNRSSQQ
jgi:hypothetical protein